MVTFGCLAKAYHMMGKACTVTHTQPHTYIHTPTHMQSSAVSATRHMLSSHTQQGQDFHQKIISRALQKHICYHQSCPHSLIISQTKLNAQYHLRDKFI